MCCLQQLTNSCLLSRNVENNLFSGAIPTKFLSVPNFRCCGFFCYAFHVCVDELPFNINLVMSCMPNPGTSYVSASLTVSF